MQKFRVTVVMSSSAQVGGGFHQSAASLRTVLEKAPGHFDIRVLDVKGTFSEEIEALIGVGLLSPASVVRLPPKLKGLTNHVVSHNHGIFRLARWILRASGKEVGASPAARFLDQSDADLVYFTSPSPIAAELLIKPFVWHIWDVCHLEFPEFPEVRTSRKFEDREKFTALALSKAAAVVADSESLKDKLNRYYKVPLHKTSVVWLSTAPGLGRVESPAPSGALTTSPWGDSPYVLYPAQFWAHKNHIRIVEALAILKNQGTDVHAVFVGKEHGSLGVVSAAIDELGMQGRIHVLGYVSDSELDHLYRHAFAVVMASYFGPTNMPPLEAWSYGVPLIASAGHEEMVKDGGILFDPDNPEDLASALASLSHVAERQSLIERGAQRLAAIGAERAVGEDALIAHLTRLERRILR